jgi:hypothetical protein
MRWQYREPSNASQAVVRFSRWLAKRSESRFFSEASFFLVRSCLLAWALRY